MIQGTAIVLAAAVLGIFLVFTVKTLKSYDDTVKVRGLCEKEVPADRVVWRINYSEKSNDLAELRNTIRNNNNLIVKKLRDAGFTEDEIKVSSASYDDRYSWSNNVSQISYRYQVHQTVTVFTKNLELVRKMQETLEGELVNENMIDAVALKSIDVFAAAEMFARTEGIVPAPESAHAICEAINEAKRAKEEGKEETILFCLSGHGFIDLGAYDSYFAKTGRGEKA